MTDNAGELPFFGPNCYGFVNFFDRAAMLPDQVVGTCPERGVALICQSGTIALTLMFNARSLPIGCLFTVGNQTRLAVEDLIEILCEDPRVTAFGLYLEGIKDAPAFARAADRARRAGKPIAMVKSGRTAAAARTAHSHTGALAGEDSVFDAFCRQAGIARVDTLSTLCETLKVLHLGGVIPGRKFLVMGASGGDMAMTADVSRSLDVDFAAIPPATADALGELLTDRVTIANPLDMHTYLWFDPPALGRVFRIALHADYDAVAFMLDCPPEGKADSTSLPETLNESTRQRCLVGGVAPLQGQREALEALSLAGAIGRTWSAGCEVRLQLPASVRHGSAGVHNLTEAGGKSALAEYGVRIPHGRVVPVAAAAEAAAELGFPVVIKAVGAHLEHKTELGGVVLNVRSIAEAGAAAARLARLSDTLLVEEMTTDGVLELLVGVIVDPQFGQVLVLGAGGVLTELLSDSVSLLPPWTAGTVRAGLQRLAAARLLAGYRGKPAGDVEALVGAILAIGRYASTHLDTLVELDVNPVIVRPAGKGVVAVDAMIRLHPAD